MHRLNLSELSDTGLTIVHGKDYRVLENGKDHYCPYNCTGEMDSYVSYLERNDRHGICEKRNKNTGKWELIKEF